MAVVIETTLGDITVDLFVEHRPQTCLNFLKLCKMKYYNFNLFHTIQSGFIAQAGDPTGEGSGGQSLWGLLHGPEKRYFSGEKRPKIRHTDAGLISMVCVGDDLVGSQFFFTLAPDLDSLDDVHCVFGEVTEGHDILRKLNEVICDDSHRPYQDVRVTHTVILDDPFNDPSGLTVPSRSPSPSAERLAGGRIAPDEEIDETKGKTAAEIQEIIEEKEAKARATILEIVGDLPDADIAPPENVLFVCKLNPVTTDEDLEIIFCRFGKIVTCEVIRDKKTGDSLQYAFIEFADKKSCEDAYFKMDNVLIDDRRIHVDFSQSVSKIKWLGKGRGVKHFSDNELKNLEKRQRSRRSQSRERPDKERHSNQKYEHYKNKERRHRSKSRSPQNSKKHTSRHTDSSRNKHQDREKERDRHSYSSSKHGEDKRKHDKYKYDDNRTVRRHYDDSDKSKQDDYYSKRKRTDDSDRRKKDDNDKSNDRHKTQRKEEESNRKTKRR